MSLRRTQIRIALRRLRWAGVDLLRAIVGSKADQAPDVLHVPIEPSHPSLLCRCDPSDDHAPDCRWLAAMCEACSGTGYCQCCGGDGCRPSTVSDPTTNSKGPIP